MTVRLEDDALRDLQDGFEFYEKSEKGAGWYFLDKIKIEIAALGSTGGIHRKRHGFFFCVSTRFPFGFHYRGRVGYRQGFRSSGLQARPGIDR